MGREVHNMMYSAIDLVTPSKGTEAGDKNIYCPFFLDTTLPNPKKCRRRTNPNCSHLLCVRCCSVLSALCNTHKCNTQFDPADPETASLMKEQAELWMKIRSEADPLIRAFNEPKNNVSNNFINNSVTNNISNNIRTHVTNFGLTSPVRMLSLSLGVRRPDYDLPKPQLNDFPPYFVLYPVSSVHPQMYNQPQHHYLQSYAPTLPPYQQKNDTSVYSHVKRLAETSVICYAIGFLLFLPHLISVLISLHMVQKNYILKGREMIAVLSALELLAWMSVPSFSWYTQTECTSSYDTGSPSCSTVYYGFISVLVWFAVVLICGFPRIILTHKFERKYHKLNNKDNNEPVNSNNNNTNNV